jgi:hypothetical protein
MAASPPPLRCTVPFAHSLIRTRPLGVCGVCPSRVSFSTTIPANPALLHPWTAHPPLLRAHSPPSLPSPAPSRSTSPRQDHRPSCVLSHPMHEVLRSRNLALLRHSKNRIVCVPRRLLPLPGRAQARWAATLAWTLFLLPPRMPLACAQTAYAQCAVGWEQTSPAQLGQATYGAPANAELQLVSSSENHL